MTSKDRVELMQWCIQKAIEINDKPHHSTYNHAAGYYQCPIVSIETVLKDANKLYKACKGAN